MAIYMGKVKVSGSGSGGGSSTISCKFSETAISGIVEANNGNINNLLTANNENINNLLTANNENINNLLTANNGNINNLLTANNGNLSSIISSIVREEIRTIGGNGGTYYVDENRTLHLYSQIVNQSFNNTQYILSAEGLCALELVANYTGNKTTGTFYGSGVHGVNFPNVRFVDYWAFNACNSLTSVNLPLATWIGEAVFRTCTSLTSLSLPSVTSIGNYAFTDCTSLTSLSLPSVTSIGNQAFYQCTSLTSITLGNESQVATLTNTNAFDGLPSSYKVYVPSSLLSQYKAAENWSNIADHIEAIQS